MSLSRVVVVLALATGLLGASCSTVPVSGRSQLSLVSSSEMMSMSYQQYSEFIKTNKSDATRIRQIRENLPEAMKYYKK